MPTSGPKILVADDHDAITAMVVAVIRAAMPDAEVLEAHDGLAAWRIVCDARPSVVITDLEMPGMDGFELCRRIKANKATCDAEVIATTAHHCEQVAAKFLQGGARACFGKPFQLSRLLDEVQQSLRREGSGNEQAEEHAR